MIYTEISDQLYYERHAKRAMTPQPHLLDETRLINKRIKQLERIELRYNTLIFTDSTHSVLYMCMKHLSPKMRQLSRYRRAVKMTTTTSGTVEKAKLVPILDLYSFDKLTKRGRHLSACCPFHEDNTPSFIINKDNTFKCFSCGAYGDSINFIMKLNNVDFITAVNFLNRS